MKKIILILIVLFPCILLAQAKKVSLEEAIKIAQKNSPDYKNNLNRNQSYYWRFKNYKASFLPQLRLNATLPSYSKSTQRMTNDLGQDVFVDQNQLRLEGGLSVSQNVPFTGGTISMNSNLDRVELFGLNDNINYQIIPFSLRYYQNSLFYNDFRWNKKIEPLVYEESKREFIENMEQISVKTSQYYFNLLKAQMQLEIAEINLSNQDTLYKIAQGRFKIGNIAENELLQMELAFLNSKNRLTTSQITLKKSAQDFARYLELNTEDLTLEIPDILPLFEVSSSKALEEAQSNRKAVIAFRRQRLQAEQELARVKGSNRLELRLNANFGLSQNGNEFDALFSNYIEQQNVSVSIALPLFDWGVSKSKRKMAEADLDLTKNNIEQDQQAFEQEIFLHVLNWSSKRVFLETSQKAKEIADKSYEITKKRYILGKVTITDLNISQENRDSAMVSYLNSLQNFWNDYFVLRQLTLYDFINQKKIEMDDIIYD